VNIPTLAASSPENVITMHQTVNEKQNDGQNSEKIFKGCERLTRNTCLPLGLVSSVTLPRSIRSNAEINGDWNTN